MHPLQANRYSDRRISPGKKLQSLQPEFGNVPCRVVDSACGSTPFLEFVSLLASAVLICCQIWTEILIIR